MPNKPSIKKIFKYIDTISIYLFMVLTFIILICSHVMDNYVKEILDSSTFSSDKIFQSAITSTSILLGFSGTLITQILYTKRENQRNLVYSFLKNACKPLSALLISSIICGISSIVLSIIMMTCSVMTENAARFLFYVWLVVFIFFFAFELKVYKLFISLLFENEEEVPKCANELSDKEKNDIFERIENNSKCKKNG